jgi:hypothetical protein
MYWTGVSLNRATALVPIAERVGADAIASELIVWLKTTIEEHFRATDNDGVVKTEQVYWYDQLWTTVIGYPGGFGAHTELNDPPLPIRLLDQGRRRDRPPRSHLDRARPLGRDDRPARPRHRNRRA